MRELIARLLREEEGQDLVEYVLLVALIGLAVATAFPALVTAMQTVFGNVADELGSAGGSS
jgi:pilus assembly protein Flp/PilA